MLQYMYSTIHVNYKDCNSTKPVNAPEPGTRHRAYDEVHLVPRSKNYNVLCITMYKALLRTYKACKGESEGEQE